MSPTFRRPAAEPARSPNPEQLLDDLPRTKDRVPSLWAHQADVLRRYSDDHLTTPDLALELPTGAGKTLPALLIAEWRRREFGKRVAYACPNHQLAHQVASHARANGIEAVTLVGSHRAWATDLRSEYDAANALAVTTYSTIFNSNPHLSQPGTLIFDDAHAGEGYVSSAWSLSVSRSEDEALHRSIIEVFEHDLLELHYQRLLVADTDPITRHDVRLLPPSVIRKRAPRLDRVLSKLEGDYKYRYSMIRGQLDKCNIYLSWRGVLIRPYIPPTSSHEIFRDADQRLYLSATLGEGGELERSFGRAEIERLPVPRGWDRRGSGRRFFVFPDLIENVESRSLARSIVERVGKALVIAPSDRELRESTDALVPEGMPVYGKEDVETSLDAFANCARGVLGLSNRYDGMDFPDEACRLTVLDGAPRGHHLQESFLIRTLRSSRVVEERLRTRVIQGAGRSTRGLTDYSIVVVLGDELTRFLSRREVRSALRPENQAEIEFGLENSKVSEEELYEYVASFVAQDDDWTHEAEPIISEMKREVTTVLPPGTDVLAAVAGAEVRACDFLWRGDYASASQAATEVARELAPEEVLRPYRSLWLYFAAAWQRAAADESGDLSRAANAEELLRQAHAAATGMTWLRETLPLPSDQEVLGRLDETAVEALVGTKFASLSGPKWASRVSRMMNGLTGTDHGPFEAALSELGLLLGAEAFKPPGQGRADSAWLFGDEWWVTLEAKSEAKSDGLVSMKDVRQANTQLKLLAADRSVEAPLGSSSVIVTPKLLSDPDASRVAAAHLFMVHPDVVADIATDVVQAWQMIRARASGLDEDQRAKVIGAELSNARVLPSHVRARLVEVGVG